MCNASQDEWCDHIQPRLEADKDSWYMMGNYGNMLQKSRRKKPNTVDDEEDEPGDGYMSEGDFGGKTEDDSQTSEEDATDDSESSEEEEGELIPGSARVTASGSIS